MRPRADQAGDALIDRIIAENHPDWS
jgi:hypothetical protein